MTQVWHYDIGVVLDGNSLRWKITVQALRMKEKGILYTHLCFVEPMYRSIKYNLSFSLIQTSIIPRLSDL